MWPFILGSKVDMGLGRTVVFIKIGGFRVRFRESLSLAPKPLLSVPNDT